MKKNKTQTDGYETETATEAAAWTGRRLLPWVSLVLLMAMIVPALCSLAQEPRVIQITADSENRFKVAGQKQPVITVKAKDVIKFKVTAHKGTEFDPKDGAVHSFSVKELKDQGWDVRLKEGMNEFVLVAPDKPGEYNIECTIKCGKGHDDMGMKLIVTP